MTCKELNKDWGTQGARIQRQVDELNASIEATYKIFGSDGAFRRVVHDRYESRVNRAVFDIMTFYLADPTLQARAIDRATSVVATYRPLCGDPEFNQSLERTTKSIKSTSCRLKLWGQALESALGIPVTPPVILEAAA